MNADPELGSFVTANLVDGQETHQGVLFRIFRDETADVIGVGATFHCSMRGMKVVEDKDLFGDAKDLTTKVRKKLGYL
jgi:hypothetical protein